MAFPYPGFFFPCPPPPENPQPHGMPQCIFVPRQPPQEQPPSQYGNTTYRYVTKDGGPPNMGAPPKHADNPPAYSCLPQPSTGPPQQCPTPSWGQPSCWVPIQAQPADKPHSYPQHQPQPPAKMQPVTGNRVNGDKLSKFRDGVGYIYHKNNVTFHLLHDNFRQTHRSHNGVVQLSDEEMNPHSRIGVFQVHLASCEMDIVEFLEQIDCRKRVGREVHPRDIGIQQVLDGGNGRFYPSSKIMLAEEIERAEQGRPRKIRGIWPETAGQAGGTEPIWIVRLP